MTWIPDLSSYAFIIHAPFVRAIGWLGRGQPFPTGAVPADFVARLTEIARRADSSELAYGFGRFMGYHTCDICPSQPRDNESAIRHSGLRNLAVPFGPLLFVCPELVDHYVREHGYRPPPEFITAVLETPLPEPMDNLISRVGPIASGQHLSMDQLVAMDQESAATEYGRIALTFRTRLAVLASLDHEVVAAAARAWTIKGRCPRCDHWTYGHVTTGACCNVELIDV